MPPKVLGSVCIYTVSLNQHLINIQIVTPSCWGSHLAWKPGYNEIHLNNEEWVLITLDNVSTLISQISRMRLTRVSQFFWGAWWLFECMIYKVNYKKNHFKTQILRCANLIWGARLIWEIRVCNHPFTSASIHLQLNPSIHICIHPSIHIYIHPSSSASTHPDLHPSIHIHLYPSKSMSLIMHPSIHICIHLSTTKFAFLHLHPSIHICIYPSASVFPHLHLSICISLSTSASIHLHSHPSIHVQIHNHIYPSWSIYPSKSIHPDPFFQFYPICIVPWDRGLIRHNWSNRWLNQEGLSDSGNWLFHSKLYTKKKDENVKKDCFPSTLMTVFRDVWFHQKYKMVDPIKMSQWVPPFMPILAKAWNNLFQVIGT